MKLFKIWQTENKNYTYDSAVIAAKSKKDAVDIIIMFFIGRGWLGLDWSRDTWVSSDKVSVEYLGTAKSKIKRGVICASFRAG